MRSGRGAAATVFAAVVSRAWASFAPSAASPLCSARAIRYATSSGRSGLASTKLHEPTVAIGASWPGYEPAGIVMARRNEYFASTRLTWSASGAMKRPPAFVTAVKPGQPTPAPQRAAARPSSTIAGPSPARSR